MRYDDKDRISRVLEEYNNLSECILLECNLKNYGMTVELVFNYIWEDNGTVRSNLKSQEILVLTFHIVQELHIRNVLSDIVCINQEEINWGINEIALVKIENDQNFLCPYQSLSIPFNHIVIFWEDERRIDIVFSALEIIRR